MNRNVIIVIVLVIMVLITAVQAIQLNSLKTSISTNKVNVGGASSTQNSNTLPPSLENAPSMVGGC